MGLFPAFPTWCLELPFPRLFASFYGLWWPANTRQHLLSGCTTLGSGGGGSMRPQHHRSINHALQANGELVRLSGLPARGWYPKQRQTRSSASTEHLDRLGTMRAWETASASRKTTTLPPNMTPPKFFNKSPREALRRVTSLLINRKGITSLNVYLLCF